MKTKRITILDTTLRDGEQSPGASMSPAEKLLLAHALSLAGVDIIEAGYAFSSISEFEAISRIGSEVEGPVICSLARACKQDIDAAHRALVAARTRRVNIFHSTSDIHLIHQLRLTRAEALHRISEMVGYASTLFDDIEFCPMDSTRTDPVYLCEVLSAAIGCGATTLNIADTVGISTPEEFHDLITFIRAHTPGIETVNLSVHCHNDLGLAVANTLAGISAGATQVECTLNGIGERAGNCSVNQLARVLSLRGDLYGSGCGLDMSALDEASALLETMIMPGVGAQSLSAQAPGSLCLDPVLLDLIP